MRCCRVVGVRSYYLDELANRVRVPLAVAREELAVRALEGGDTHVAAGMRLAQRRSICAYAARRHAEWQPPFFERVASW